MTSEFLARVDRLMRRGVRAVVLDAAALPPLDYDGLGVLYEALARLQERGGGLHIIGAARMPADFRSDVRFRIETEGRRIRLRGAALDEHEPRLTQALAGAEIVDASGLLHLSPRCAEALLRRPLRIDGLRPAIRGFLASRVE